MAGGADRVLRVAVWLNRLADAGAVGASVGIARDSVPVERRRVSQAAHRHGGTWHDLVAPRNNRSLQYPEQLIGMPVRVTAGAGKSLGR